MQILQTAKAKLENLKTKLKDNSWLLACLAYPSQGINVFFIVSLLTSGATSTNSFVVFLISITAIAIAFAVIGHAIDGGTKDLENAVEVLKGKNHTKNNYKNYKDRNFWIIIGINALALVAASANIIKHAITPSDLTPNQSWHQNKTIILTIFVALMIVCFIAKVYELCILQVRTSLPELVESALNEIKGENSNVISENISINMTTTNPFTLINNTTNTAPKTNKLLINGIAALIAVILTIIYGCAATKLLPSLPVYFYIISTILLGLISFTLFRRPVTAMFEKLAESDEVHNEKENAKLTALKQVFNIPEDNIIAPETAKNLLIRYWNYIKNPDAIDWSVSQRFKFYVFLPIFNFIAISIPIYYGLYVLCELAKIPLPDPNCIPSMLIVLFITFTSALVYASTKANGALADWQFGQISKAFTDCNKILDQAAKITPAGNPAADNPAGKPEDSPRP